MLPQPALFTGATPVLAPQVLTDLPDMLLDATLNTQLALALLRHMVQPVIVMDPDGRVTLVNAAGMALISPTAVSALEGRFWGDLWPHADSADLRAALAQAVAAGGTPVIVSHGLALQVMLADLLGVPFAEAWQDQRFAHANTAYSELVAHGDGWQAVQVAQAGHLAGLS